ncbi:thioredoxin family protein [Pontibacter russatus]|uniref:thioredoxin family protein n=1 Tax=Pontibacter russatus TaxID=2694929 RepID=UPI00137B117D|nr:thioredoxin fold domain-containing protein [Pontibacter russatus]
MLQKNLPALLLLSLPFAYIGHRPITAVAPATVSASAPVHLTAATLPAAKIQWLTIEQAEEKLKQEPRKVLVDVYTDWCGWCKKMDKDTFTDPEVVAHINRNFYAVKLDAEGEKPITLKGRTFDFKPDYRAHELAVALLNGQMSFPTTVFLDEELNMLTPVPGYLDAKNMSQILKYFGEDYHLKMTWPEFEKQTK